MKRAVLVILLALVFTIASAWLPAARAAVPRTGWEAYWPLSEPEIYLPSYIADWPHGTVRGEAFSLGRAWGADTVSLSFDLARQIPGYAKGSGNLYLARFGWPRRCMQFSTLSFDANAHESYATQAIDIYKRYFNSVGTRREAAFPSWLVSRNPKPTAPRRVPLEPIPTGFVANFAVYAVAGALLLYVPGLARTLYRKRRNLCPSCAYPTGTSPICTECGKPVKPRSAATP